MAQGWVVLDEVMVECTRYFKQETSVYHFELWLEEQHRNMCVIANPAVERLIRNLGLRCVQMEMYR
jgi:hypothetical protein